MAINISNMAMGNNAHLVQDSARQKRAATPIEQKSDYPQPRQELPADVQRRMAAELQKMIVLPFDSRLQFLIDQESKEIRVKVIDNKTDKVIRELPPEELRRSSSKIRGATGSLVNREV
ncbi:MAG: flagellar protein FlaG [Treponema sp.]|nr:flagellar protein FlaG [Treponema sp.]